MASLLDATLAFRFGVATLPAMLLRLSAMTIPYVYFLPPKLSCITGGGG